MNRLALFLFATLSINSVYGQTGTKQMVRLAKLQIDTTQLETYNAFLREEIEASIRVEPGVLTLYAVAATAHPQNVTLFETYADSSQYKAHLATPHFQKYKVGTKAMVRHLELIEANAIIYIRKKELAQAGTEQLVIRLVELEIDTTQLNEFNRLATEIMFPGMQKEQGMLMMYAVAEKLRPTHISILEVYANENAYEEHRGTSHFIEYKEKSKKMVRSLRLIDVKPLLLGSKPQ